jgi:hypothetical protein
VPRLGSLNLRGTAVTDAGLARLKRLTALRSVILPSAGVSDAAIEDLRRTLPGVGISRD